MYNVLYSPLELNRCWRLRAYISVILKLFPAASTYTRMYVSVGLGVVKSRVLKTENKAKAVRLDEYIWQAICK